MSRHTPIILLTLLLCACTSDAVQPKLSFIGVATGTLVTDLNALAFSNMFRTDDRNLVAVVGFEEVEEGTTVQATWFSPDDRNMPLGRTSIVTQSGATIARFSFVSNDPWTPAPYMLQVHAFTGEGDDMRSATGSVSFFIGMNDRQIAQYRQEFENWKAVESVHRAEWEREQADFQQLLARIRKELSFEYGAVLLRTDLTGDQSEDYVIADKAEAAAQTEAVGVIASSDVGRFAVVSHSGSVLLAVRDDGKKRIAESLGVRLTDILPSGDATMQLSVLPSFALSLYWPRGDAEVCFAEFEPSGGGYVLAREGCRPL